MQQVCRNNMRRDRMSKWNLFGNSIHHCDNPGVPIIDGGIEFTVTGSEPVADAIFAALV
jgi:hypothetical protein